MFVGLLAHSFATIANFQWFSKLPSPLNGMVEGNHWDQWFSDGFGVRQPLVMMVFLWYDDGMVMYHRQSLIDAQGHLSAAKYLLSNVPLSSRNPGPKKGTDNFCIGGANLQVGSGDGGVSLCTSGCQDCLVSLNRQTILSG